MSSYIQVCLQTTTHSLIITCILLAYIVSLALKLRSYRGTVTRSAAIMWDTHLLNRNRQLSMNKIQIDALKIGLEFGKAIELKEDLMLKPHQMLSGQDRVRKFIRLRYSSTVKQLFVFPVCSSKIFSFICSMYPEELRTFKNSAYKTACVRVYSSFYIGSKRSRYVRFYPKLFFFRALQRESLSVLSAVTANSVG